MNGSKIQWSRFLPPGAFAEVQQENANLRDQLITRESQLAAAKGALEAIAAYRSVIEEKFRIVTGYEENMVETAEEALVALSGEGKGEGK